jgi:hypothetical protein
MSWRDLSGRFVSSLEILRMLTAKCGLFVFCWKVIHGRA